VTDTSKEFHGETPEQEMILLPLTVDEFQFICLVLAQEESSIKHNDYAFWLAAAALLVAPLTNDRKALNALVNKTNKIVRSLKGITLFNDHGQ
jgi:hypothetical protein